MKTNIANLMNILAEEERNLNVVWGDLRAHVYNIKTKELDGTENIIDDYKEDFENEYNEYMQLANKLEKIKKAINEKNNEFKLPNGNSIQGALVEISILRKKINMINEFSDYKSVNRRITEVNNSYFEYKTLNFDTKKLKEEAKNIEEKIRNLEFEISKLNSIEFDIEL